MSNNGFFRGMNRQTKRAMSKSDTIQGIEQLAEELGKLKQGVGRVDQDVDTLLGLLVKDPTPSGYQVNKGDTLVIGFLGRLYKEDGTVSEMPFNGGVADNMIVNSLGSGEMIPGFEDQIVGKNVGDSFDIDVTFPGDYKAMELAGKKASFLVVVHAAFKTRVTGGLIQAKQSEMIKTMVARQKAEQESKLKALAAQESLNEAQTPDQSPVNSELQASN